MIEVLEPDAVDVASPAEREPGESPGGGVRRTERHSLLIAALARGSSVEQAAIAANMARSSAYRAIRTPEVRDQLRELRARSLDAAASAAAAATGEAVERVVELMRTAKSESTRLRAAEMLLAYSGQAQTMAEQSAEILAMRSEVDSILGAGNGGGRW